MADVAVHGRSRKPVASAAMIRPPRIFSYVVDHDHGYAPNPMPPWCTLAQCKYGTERRRNIVELAEPGDWVIGSGGRGSSGADTLLYLMRVTEKPGFPEFLRDLRFQGRVDHHRASPRRFALVSDDYVYFGRNAPTLVSLGLDPRRFAKSGRGFRHVAMSDLQDLLAVVPERGLRGMPVAPHPDWASSHDPDIAIVADDRPSASFYREEDAPSASADDSTDPAVGRCSGSRSGACRGRRRCGPFRRSVRRRGRAGLR